MDTKESIKRQFMKEYSNKVFSLITVKGLCAATPVARTTFYSYYDNICEKPSVGAAIAAAFGISEKKNGYFESDEYIISWYIEHLIGLAEASKYDKNIRNGVMGICLLFLTVSSLVWQKIKKNNSAF